MAALAGDSRGRVIESGDSRIVIARRSVTPVDPFDDLQQPRCPECGTVLMTASRGFVCRACNLAFVDAIAVADRLDIMR